ncbi:MAG: hypothetical protein US61_C0036G0007 [Parcubacteria group bacterium GW2011_GWE2_37_8]|nr:MAG: hypothetical protein US61_C0036G0007 [Parcubacteria group bacterium GW2011_GWE2_37_8]
MFLNEEKNKKKTEITSEQMAQIFDDPEAKRNIVGLYDLLFKIAKRNPRLWAEIQKPIQHD